VGRGYRRPDSRSTAGGRLDRDHVERAIRRASVRRGVHLAGQARPQAVNILRDAIINTSRQIGVDPVDLATIISYETSGTFDPWKAGPTTQWGQHRGLSQWGEPQRQKYGVTRDMPVEQQVAAAGRYLVDAGVKPGMGILDMYSAINAG